MKNRRTVGKGMAATATVLALPLLFLAMLPGLIFGDLSENTGALNDAALISENIRAASQAITEILSECHDKVLEEVNAEAASVPEGDTVSINDPYALSIPVNAIRIIAQYCASRDDYREINLDSLKSVIRENSEGLFDYEHTTEEATVEGDRGEVTVTRHTFIISYAGDSYFSDQVFHLTDKQKKIAEAYAENLTTFLGVDSNGVAMAVNLSPEVIAYRPVVERIARMYGMEQYVELILAVMMQESGGRLPDVMQAAEGAFNTRYPHVPNGITDPEYSIECGIQELKYALDKAGCTGPADLDRIKLALQGYNYGSGYIDWAIARDGGYTKENAIAFSDMMCARPDWPYSIYGDKDYVEHVLRYYTIVSTGTNTPAGGMQIPHFLQTDYGNIPYGGGSIASSGCGPTSFAMVASYLTGTTITPIDAVSWCGNAYYVPGAGTSWSYFEGAARHFGIGSVVQTNDPNAVLTALSQGRPVISSQNPGLFTRGGHFIVLRGVTAAGKVLVNDPNDSPSKNYENREFDFLSEIHATAAAYWIFDRK